MRGIGAIGIVLTLVGSAVAADPTPADIFQKRILPIFRSPNPSSCAECHLAGVDLKQYLLPDADKTFRSLRDQGLINLDRPAESKIIQLIERSDPKRTTGPASVTAKLREQERAAFLAWITACAADPTLRSSPKLAEADRAHPARPDEVIRHARTDRLLTSFEKNVWAWRFRCMNCHTEGSPQNDKFKAEHGERVAWVKKAGAQATMDYLLQSKLIDLSNPEASPLLRKPLGDKHQGGIKFAVGDEAYKGFRAWIEDVAAIRKDRYATAKDLPPADQAPSRFGTEIWFKISDCPPEWGEKLLQVRIDRKTADDWEEVAISDRIVSGKLKLWQHTLTLLATPRSEQARTWSQGKPTLAEGIYRARIYLDKEGRLAKDWQATLGEADRVAVVEFRSRWQEGYGAMTTIPAPKR